jgi:hypothetical protein
MAPKAAKKAKGAQFVRLPHTTFSRATKLVEEKGEKSKALTSGKAFDDMATCVSLPPKILQAKEFDAPVRLRQTYGVGRFEDRAKPQTVAEAFALPGFEQHVEPLEMLRDGKVPPDPDGFYAYAPKAEVKKMNDAIKGRVREATLLGKKILKQVNDHVAKQTKRSTVEKAAQTLGEDVAREEDNCAFLESLSEMESVFGSTAKERTIVLWELSETMQRVRETALAELRLFMDAALRFVPFTAIAYGQNVHVYREQIPDRKNAQDVQTCLAWMDQLNLRGERPRFYEVLDPLLHARPTEVVICCTEETVLRMKDQDSQGALERSEKDLASHVTRHPIFRMRAVLLCPSADSEPAAEAIAFLRRICEERVRVVHVPQGGSHQLHEDAGPTLAKARQALAKRKKAYQKKLITLQGHEDLTERLAEFRAVAHRQLAVQDLLKDDMACIKAEMKRPTHPARPETCTGPRQLEYAEGARLNRKDLLEVEHLMSLI